jgi:predicted RNA polymerase sigma factor
VDPAGGRAARLGPVGPAGIDSSAVFLLREVFELDVDEIARSAGKSEANTRQILTRARGRLRDSGPRFTVSRRESEEIVRRFRLSIAIAKRTRSEAWTGIRWTPRSRNSRAGASGAVRSGDPRK